MKFTAALFTTLLLTACATSPPAPPAARAALAPSGKLRAGINRGNGVVRTRYPATGPAPGNAGTIPRELGQTSGVRVAIRGGSDRVARCPQAAGFAGNVSARQDGGAACIASCATRFAPCNLRTSV